MKTTKNKNEMKKLLSEEKEIFGLKNILSILLIFVLILSISEISIAEGFCGYSTNATCSAHSECKSGGGCSGEVCEGINESTITACVIFDCYNPQTYNVTCGCVAGMCQWTPDTQEAQNTSANDAMQCYGEGESFNSITAGNITCCTGLMAVSDSISTNGSCANPKCPCYVCTNCGDGNCGMGENECNCPADCNCTGAGDIPEMYGCCEGLSAVSNSMPDPDNPGTCLDMDHEVCLSCGDGVCGVGENICNSPADCNCTDTDGDGVCDDTDNCINISNPNQNDTDGDGIGDACESLPDLVAEIDYVPKNATVGDTVTIIVTIKNIGNVNLTNVASGVTKPIMMNVPFPPIDVPAKSEKNWTDTWTLRYGKDILSLWVNDQTNIATSLIFDFPVKIETDKDTYLPDESINIKITGDYGAGIVYTSCESYKIYKYTKGSWTHISDNCEYVGGNYPNCSPCTDGCPCWDPQISLPSCEEQLINYTWVWGESVTPGNYKAVFCYSSYGGMGCNPDICIETPNFTIQGYTITNLNPIENLSAELVDDPSIDPTNTTYGLSGTHNTRIKKDNKPVFDVPINFTGNPDFSELTVYVSNNTGKGMVIVHFGNETKAHKSGSKTLYVPVISNSGKVCVASSITNITGMENEIANNCSNGDWLMLPQINLNGNSYYMINSSMTAHVNGTGAFESENNCSNYSYNPVCGTNNLTYNNSCLAKLAGADILYKGECKEGWNWWYPPKLQLNSVKPFSMPGENPIIKIETDFYDINFSVYSLTPGDLKYENYELLSTIENRTPVKTWIEEVEESTKKVTIPINDTGAYFVIASYKRSSDDNTTIFNEKSGVTVFVSKLGLISKSVDNKTLIYAINSGTGEPLENTTISFYDNNKNLISDGVTGEMGTYETKLNPDSFKVIGNYNNHLMNLAVYNNYNTKYLKGLKVNIYTDRPIYRPNHRVFFKGIVWSENNNNNDNTNNNSDNYEILAGEEIKIKIKSANNRGTIYDNTLYTNEFGTISDEIILGDEIPLGTYTIEFTIRNSQYYGSFDVKEYRKPEYKVTLNSDKETYIRGDNVTLGVSAEYFFGMPVVEGEVSYKVYRSSYYAPRPCYGWICPAYSMPYPYSNSEELIANGETITNENGIAEITFETDKNYSYNSRYGIKVDVTDKSRHTVREEISVMVSNAEFDLKITADKYGYDINETVNVKVTAEDIAMNPANAYAEISVTKIEWKYTNNNWIQNKTIILKQNITINHTANIQFTPEEYGTYIIEAKSNDSYQNEVYASRSVWVYSYYGHYNIKTNYNNPEQDQNSIELILDKDIYESRETAKLLINSPVSDFYAYITIEGEDIYAHKVVYVNGTAGVADIELKSNYMPNVFVNVMIVKNNTYYTNTREFFVIDSSKFLNISVIPDKNIYLPGDAAKFLIEVKNSNGTPADAELSLSIVDEAIYSLKDDTSMLEDFFYNQRRENKVKTHYWLKMAKIGAKIGSSIYPYYYPPVPVMCDSVVMDSDVKITSPYAPAKVRKYFPDTAFWNAHILVKNGTASVELTMPDSLTTWRLTAKGINLNKQVGTKRDTTIVRKNLFVRAETPRFFTERDKLLISGVVHNYLGHQKDVFVTINTSGNIDVIGSKQRTITVAHGSDERVDWKVYIKERSIGNITICSYTNEESDCMNVLVPIIPYGTKKIETISGIVENNETTEIIEFNVNSSGMANMYVTSSLIGDALDSLDYLIHYPYGCMEQTMSAFLPDIIVVRVINEPGIELDNEELEKELPDMVNRGLQRIYDFQHSDGGWGWWKDDNTHPYMTAYLMYGLTKARDAGFSVDDEVFDNGLDSLRNQTVDVGDSNIKAYMLYSLSHHDNISGYDVNETALSDYGKALYALALFNSEDNEKANELINELNKSAKCSGTECHWDAETFKYSWRNNKIETTSYISMAMLKGDPGNEKIKKGIEYLINHKQGNRWHSTKDTAIAVMAIMEYITAYNEVNPGYDADIYLNDELIKNYSVGSFFEDKFDLNLVNGTNKINITKNGICRIYYKITYEHYTTEENITAYTNGIEVIREYGSNNARSGDEVNVTLLRIWNI